MSNTNFANTVSKTEARAELSSEIEKFLASGGSITKVRSGRAYGAVSQKMRDKMRMGKNGRQ